MTAQLDLFVTDLSDERLDALITEAARPIHCVIDAGAQMRGHCGTYTQPQTVIKLGMDEFTLKQLRPLFKRFLTLAKDES